MTESNNALTVKRDNLGRFVSGNSGNPSGRSARKTEHDYLELAKQKCGKSQWLAIVEKAVEQAMQGDARARQWLSDYLMGKPISMVMAVQEKQENVLIVKYAIQEKLRKIADENSDKPITVAWDD